jgi:membrane protease YdiL (CAAX protease family)
VNRPTVDRRPAQWRQVEPGAALAWAAVLFSLVALALGTLWLLGAEPDQPAPGGPAPVALAAVLLVAYSPTLAALAVAAGWRGGGGVRRLLRGAVRWRVSAGWYAAALAGPALLVLGAVRLHVALGGQPPDRLLDLGGLGLALGSILAGAVGEEPGWRGLAQSGFQRRVGALPAAALVGLVWATWHLWPWAAPGGIHLVSGTVLAATLIRMVSTAVVYAWIYNGTGGSLLLVMLAHVGHNVAVTVVGGSADTGLLTALLYLGVAVAIVCATASRTLTRARSVSASAAVAEGAVARR